MGGVGSSAWSNDSKQSRHVVFDRAVRSIISARYSPGPFRTVSATYRYARDLSEQVELGWQWPSNPVTGSAISTGPRIGVPAAGADRDWRFWLTGEPTVSGSARLNRS